MCSGGTSLGPYSTYREFWFTKLSFPFYDMFIFSSGIHQYRGFGGGMEALTVALMRWHCTAFHIMVLSRDNSSLLVLWVALELRSLGNFPSVIDHFPNRIKIKRKWCNRARGKSIFTFLCWRNRFGIITPILKDFRLKGYFCVGLELSQSIPYWSYFIERLLCISKGKYEINFIIKSHPRVLCW